MYSYWPKRTALSQLVCSRDLLRSSTHEVMDLLEMGLKVERGMKWYGEPGLVSSTYRAFVEASSGRPSQLQRYLKDYVSKYTSLGFETARTLLAPNAGPKDAMTCPIGVSLRML
jgi:hypothetical protein